MCVYMIPSIVPIAYMSLRHKSKYCYYSCLFIFSKFLIEHLSRARHVQTCTTVMSRLCLPCLLLEWKTDSCQAVYVRLLIICVESQVTK